MRHRPRVQCELVPGSNRWVSDPREDPARASHRRVLPIDGMAFTRTAIQTACSPLPSLSYVQIFRSSVRLLALFASLCSKQAGLRLVVSAGGSPGKLAPTCSSAAFRRGRDGAHPSAAWPALHSLRYLMFKTSVLPSGSWLSLRAYVQNRPVSGWWFRRVDRQASWLLRVPARLSAADETELVPPRGGLLSVPFVIFCSNLPFLRPALGSFCELMFKTGRSPVGGFGGWIARQAGSYGFQRGFPPRTRRSSSLRGVEPSVLIRQGCPLEEVKLVGPVGLARCARGCALACGAPSALASLAPSYLRFSSDRGCVMEEVKLVGPVGFEPTTKGL
jgi:hypothetical protein